MNQTSLITFALVAGLILAFSHEAVGAPVSNCGNREEITVHDHDHGAGQIASASNCDSLIPSASEVQPVEALPDEEEPTVHDHDH